MDDKEILCDRSLPENIREEMKVLMTGSHGFVGSNLIELLSSKYEIVRWNAREDKVLPDCDVVIHLSGLAHDTKHSTEDAEYYAVNTELTKKIYEKFLLSSAKKFIFFSSIKAQDGDTPYALSKKAAEDFILSMRQPNKLIYILRPCMIHGPGNKGNLNLLVNVVKKGLPWPLAAFENKRSFASIGNVSFIVDRLLTLDVESGIYNICDDEPVSTNELISIIYGCMKKKIQLWRIPKSVIRIGAIIGDFLHLPLNSERLEKLTRDYIVDNSKIKNVLGMEKMPVKAVDGLESTITYMINR